eukprot:TRINITY_DN37355_c0_g1_i1.p1 TRINITY_DN37355_c0_g1~~TRINITY_DN37355_c0_g1_i1.p1  ORF type:complete len:331 (+),score=93.32 TRINITY_DN37355_c0_g1_i1:88-1080(+)
MARGPRKRKQLESSSAGASSKVDDDVEGDDTAGAAASREEKGRKKKKKLRTGKASESSKGRVDSDEEGPMTLEAGAKKIAAWADNETRFQRWMDSRGGGLEERILEAGGRIIRLRDFMPGEVADSALAVLQNLPEEAWDLSEQAGEEQAANHRFWSGDVVDIEELAPLRNVFWKMLKSLRGEPTLPIFSCGRYGSSDFIGRHDDRAHVPFFGDDNIYSRTVAAIWYLTKDWSEQDGGCLIDLQAKKDSPDRKLVPIYNSLVVFEVPHWHAVSAVISKRQRYSIFGWWHQKGQRYDLPGLVPEASKSEKVAKKGKKVIKKKAKKKVQKGGS